MARVLPVNNFSGTSFAQNMNRQSVLTKTSVNAKENINGSKAACIRSSS
jgi:hypothetical protein